MTRGMQLAPCTFAQVGADVLQRFGRRHEEIGNGRGNHHGAFGGLRRGSAGRGGLGAFGAARVYFLESQIAIETQHVAELTHRAVTCDVRCKATSSRMRPAISRLVIRDSSTGWPSRDKTMAALK